MACLLYSIRSRTEKRFWKFHLSILSFLEIYLQELLLAIHESGIVLVKPPQSRYPFLVKVNKCEMKVDLYSRDGRMQS